MEAPKKTFLRISQTHMRDKYETYKIPWFLTENIDIFVEKADWNCSNFWHFRPAVFLIFRGSRNIGSFSISQPNISPSIGWIHFHCVVKHSSGRNFESQRSNFFYFYFIAWKNVCLKFSSRENLFSKQNRDFLEKWAILSKFDLAEKNFSDNFRKTKERRRWDLQDSLITERKHSYFHWKTRLNGSNFSNVQFSFRKSSFLWSLKMINYYLKFDLSEKNIS